MKRTTIVLMSALTLVLFLGSVSAQSRGGSDKRIQEMTIVISDVDEATISYLTERRGRMRTNYIGIASITRIMKNGKEVSLKDLEKTDKAIVTLYKDPEDPYFPALSVNVVGKGELPKPRKGKKKK